MMLAWIPQRIGVRLGFLAAAALTGCAADGTTTTEAEPTQGIGEAWRVDPYKVYLDGLCDRS